MKEMEYRETALWHLDFNFQMIEEPQEMKFKKNRINCLRGVIDFLHTTHVISYNEWNYLYHVLNTYQFEILPKEERKEKENV